MVFSASEKTLFGEKTDLVCEDNGEVEPVGVDTLPGQPKRGGGQNLSEVDTLNGSATYG